MIKFSKTIRDITDTAVEYIKNKLDEDKKFKIPSGYYFDDIIGNTMEVLKVYKKKDKYYILAIDSFSIDTVEYDIDGDMMYGYMELLCEIADEISEIKSKVI